MAASSTGAHAASRKVRLPDGVMADVIDAMSYHLMPDGERRYINYRDLSVQQLGSIYERLLEYDVVREGGVVGIRQGIFSRKRTGSYYTPDYLVTSSFVKRSNR